ncbi:DUF1489 domain-containing protein [Altererythrobacter arenosus]|uniref:DUF1489 domain-containing protein n=1 Tax=Altererythrobacter arenosus TaxID=3032592 RepID=A0ABY8FNF9_9SPHN|nr:DUF1489 domain-containing protein [Altererythrobacter sp. CAU 1644]WFL76557.1 DUF1489 domain-containing protein [Altererythrobacter sp. CAU 1644]
MPLHMTKIAYGAASREEVRSWFETGPEEMRLTTRYLPKRHEEMQGGSLFWIYEHTLIGRSPIIGFEQKDDGRWWIKLERKLVPVHPLPKRAHQGWRYLANDKAPRDLEAGEDPDALMPATMVKDLAKLGLV